MSMNAAPSSERVHIGFFGLRNAGKSSLVNAITNQAVAVVSPVPGTTTDPVKKSMELPLGPVVIIDTPGLDDKGELGELRVMKARQVLAQTDIAVVVASAETPMQPIDEALVSLLEKRKIPYVITRTKADLLDTRLPLGERVLYVSSVTGENIGLLKERIATLGRKASNEKHLMDGLLSPSDLVVLVTPIDAAAPKGRLILPQQQIMRDILDAHCAFVTCQPEELAATLAALGKKPRLAITDSQAFRRVAKEIPPDIPLTSFSILFARYKGNLGALVEGAAALRHLKNGDKVLISEGCTHHRQCDDIGTVKMPRWIEEYCGAKPEYAFTSGGEFPNDLTGFRLVVHCGGCMLNEKEMQRRIAQAQADGVPIVNYGVAIAQMQGILRRSLAPFSEEIELLDDNMEPSSNEAPT